ncbi:unnamed protein product [Caenorhabditis angaria]|uniref:Uncharacterized protein n=1 Tax=Caenorhabditis angaria TaxID=860376 RepID=A0A9P1MV81_9PELO|nr:unnamed protein product [Caenorhabditis angaria]
MDERSWRNSTNSWKQKSADSWRGKESWHSNKPFYNDFRGGGIRGGFRGGFRGRGRGRGRSSIAVPILRDKKDDEKRVEEEQLEKDDIHEEDPNMDDMVKKQLELLKNKEDNYEQDEYDDDYFEEPVVKKTIEEIVDTSARPVFLARDPRYEKLLEDAKSAEGTKTSKNGNDKSFSNDRRNRRDRNASTSWTNSYQQRVALLKQTVESDIAQSQYSQASNVQKYQDVLRKMDDKTRPGPSVVPFNGPIPSNPFNGPVHQDIQTSRNQTMGITNAPIPYNGPIDMTFANQVTPFDDLNTRRSKMQAPSLIDPLASSKRSSRFDKPPQVGVPFNGPIGPFNGPVPTAGVSFGPVNPASNPIPESSSSRYNEPISNYQQTTSFNSPIPQQQYGISPFGVSTGQTQGFYGSDTPGPSGFFFTDSISQRPNYRGATRKRKTEPLVLPKSDPKPLYAALTGQLNNDEQDSDEDDEAIAKLREIMQFSKSK